MTGTQYKNVAQWTLANGAAEASESAAAAKAIFDNMGVPFPAGSCGEILLTLMSEDYMGWRACTHLEAQEYANAGTAAVGIDGEHVVVILPEEGEGLVGAVVQANATSYARQASDISTAERITMQFYANSAALATNLPTMNAGMYYNYIHVTDLIYPSGNITYCNIWAHNVFDKCGFIKYPTGGCTAELRAYKNGFDAWVSCNYREAQIQANYGRATIGITNTHMVVVTPNFPQEEGATIPTKIGEVFVSQSGASCFYDDYITRSWSASALSSVQFFYYNK